MSINISRTVRYTDDGCYDHQCLKCYAMWEGRSGPGGNYEPIWRFCPFCGTKWDGHIPEKERCLPFDSPYRREPWRMSYWWVFETQRTTTLFADEQPRVGPWEQRSVLDGRYSAVEILEQLRSYRVTENDASMKWSSVAVRVRIVRECPEPPYHYIPNHFRHGAWVIPDRRAK